MNIGTVLHIPTHCIKHGINKFLFFLFYRLSTSASSNHNPLMSQMYSGSQAGIPYSNRGVLHPVLGQNMGYTPQVYERENGLHNYRSTPENQEIANQPGTNVQYYTIVHHQTLHVPNTSIPKSMSDTALYSFTQINQDSHTHQLEVPYMTSHVLPHASGLQTAENPTHQTSANYSGFNEIYQNLSFPIPRASFPSDQQSYSSTSDATHAQTNPTINLSSNSSEI